MRRGTLQLFNKDRVQIYETGGIDDLAHAYTIMVLDPDASLGIWAHPTPTCGDDKCHTLLFVSRTESRSPCLFMTRSASGETLDTLDGDDKGCNACVRTRALEALIQDSRTAESY